MRSLTLRTFPVRVIRFGPATAYDAADQSLTVSAGEVEHLILADPRMAGVDIGIALPGEDVRIVNVLDVVEPREKVSGTAGIFPGILSQPVTAGSGVTHRLSGAAVVSSTVFPFDGDYLLNQENATIDMSGPASRYSPFSRTCNLVLSFRFTPGSSIADYDLSLRRATLLVARHLAEATRGVTARDEETYSLHAVPPDLPGIAYICEVPTFGMLFRTLYYGWDVTNSFPTVVHPNEFMDGALVSGDFHYAGQRTLTYFLQNSPVIAALYSGHGVTHRFCGVVLTGHFMHEKDKLRGAELAAKVAEMLGARGTVVTAAAGGNALVDALYAGRSCERLQIGSAVVLVEMCGAGGTDPGLPDFTRHNDLLISVGNREALVDLHRAERVLGGERLLHTGPESAGPLRLPIREIIGANNEQGGFVLTARTH